MKIPPKVGSKVRFAGPLFTFDPCVKVMVTCDRPVEIASDPSDSGMLRVLCPKFGHGYIHLRQITHRIVPKKRREIFINEYTGCSSGAYYCYLDDAKKYASDGCFRTVRFVEAREKK